MSTYITQSDSAYKMLGADAQRNESARQDPFQTHAHSRAMLSKTQPRARSENPQSGAMNCVREASA